MSTFSKGAETPGDFVTGCSGVALVSDFGGAGHPQFRRVSLPLS
jgi:hypothetical protein